MITRMVGRENEAKILEQYYRSDKSELVAVYGRRRVGKTYLVRETLGDLFDFEFTGIYQLAGKEQRRQKRLSFLHGKRDHGAA